MDKTYKVIMVKHGETTWKNRGYYSGWFDPILTWKGEQDARTAGKALKDAGYKFDITYTSALSRAKKTLAIILREIGQKDLPIEKTWRLNGRHCGNLTGQRKTEAVVKYGEAQMAIWRRSFDVPPPPMDEENPNYKYILRKSRRTNWPDLEEFPMCESLKQTFARTLPYWNEIIVPQIKEGKHILIAAHGSSLRAIIQHLDQITDEQVLGLKIPGGVPFLYELDEELKPVENGSLKFLGEEEAVKQAMAHVLAKGKRNRTNNTQSTV
ncbi:Phosphoglyceromutase 78 [Carabus blaptoides fortunei]